MTSQLDSLFSIHTEEEPQTKSPRRSKTPVKPLSEEEGGDLNQVVKPFTAVSEDEPASEQETKLLMEEKQKILSIAMEGF